MNQPLSRLNDRSLPPASQWPKATSGDSPQTDLPFMNKTSPIGPNMARRRCPTRRPWEEVLARDRFGPCLSKAAGGMQAAAPQGGLASTMRCARWRWRVIWWRISPSIDGRLSTLKLPLLRSVLDHTRRQLSVDFGRSSIQPGNVRNSGAEPSLPPTSLDFSFFQLNRSSAVPLDGACAKKCRYSTLCQDFN